MVDVVVVVVVGSEGEGEAVGAVPWTLADDRGLPGEGRRWAGCLRIPSF